MTIKVCSLGKSSYLWIFHCHVSLPEGHHQDSPARSTHNPSHQKWIIGAPEGPKVPISLASLPTSLCCDTEACSSCLGCTCKTWEKNWETRDKVWIGMARFRPNLGPINPTQLGPANFAENRACRTGPGSHRSSAIHRRPSHGAAAIGRLLLAIHIQG